MVVNKPSDNINLVKSLFKNSLSLKVLQFLDIVYRKNGY